jgi:ParB/RepB/Spo0J family partition protein
MTTEHYDPKFINNNPWQTRSREPDPAYIQELAQDIKANGLLQTPIGRIIQINGSAQVQLAVGHNRLRAYLYLKLPLMPVDVRELSDEQMADFAWSENEKRRDHTAIERAMAIQKRIDDFGWSNRVCSEHLGIDHSTLSNILRLLKLPENIQDEILQGKLSERQAEAMLPIFDVPASMDRNFGFWSYRFSEQAHISINTLSEIVIKQGWSSDVIRKVVDEYFERFGKDLKNAEFKLDQLIPEGNDVYCGLCKTCDKRMASRNFCFDQGCFKAKTEFIHQEYLLKASAASGYPLDDVEKGGYPSTLPDYDKKARERIIASKCPSLVLIFQKDATDIEGYPNVRLVCTKRNNSCSCIKGLNVLASQGNLPPQVASPMISEGTGETMIEVKSAETLTSDEGEKAELIQAAPAITSDELEEAARQARRGKMAVEKQKEEIQRKLAKHLLQAIEMLKPGAFYIGIHRDRYPSKSNLELEKIFKYLANEGARVLMPIGADNIDQEMKWINESLKKLELEPFSLEEPKPASMELIELMNKAEKDAEKAAKIPIF